MRTTPGIAGLGRPAAGVAGQRDRPGRGAVVRAVAGDDLGASRDVAGEPDRVLVGGRAAGGEERRLQVARRDRGDQRSQLAAGVVGHRGADVAEPLGLPLDRLDDARVLVAEVEVDELGLEVEVTLAVGVPEPAALAAGDGERVDRRLDRPRRDRELAMGRGDPLGVVGPDVGEPVGQLRRGAARSLTVPMVSSLTVRAPSRTRPVGPAVGRC